MIKVIVTGTGRCGTSFSAKLLTKMGLPCGHESIFDYSEEEVIKQRLLDENKRTLSLVSERNDPNWIDPKTTQAESSYLAAPYLDWAELDNVKIIHIFRNPINVVRSFLLDFGYFQKNEPNTENIFNELGFEQKIWKALPNLSEIKTPIERACYFYVEWNKLIRNKSRNKEVLMVRIEDQQKNKKIADFLELQAVEFNKKENSFDLGKKIYLKDVPEGKIKEEFIKLTRRLSYM